MSENKLPSFEELFGNLDYQNADEYRSVLSPAAYLTDIMDLKNWRYDHGNIDEIDAVDDRREDISEILLNKENTITEIPHLDVVNDIMERRVKVLNNGEEPYPSLKSAQFPFNLPFNRAHTEIGHMLGYLKTSPSEFYRLFTANPDANTQAREALGLSSEEYANLITPVTDEAGLLTQYGIENGEPLTELYKLTRFRKATEMSAIQVLELLYQNLSIEEKDSGVSSRFFINSQVEGGAWLVTDLKDDNDEETDEEEQLYLRTVSGATVADIDPPLEYLDRINRFIRTSRKTGLTFAELDLVLIKACGGQLDENAMQIIAVVKWLRDKYEVPIEEICILFAGIKDYGMGENDIPDDLFNKMFNNRRDKPIQNFTGAELTNRLQAGLGLSENDYNTIADYLAENDKTITPDPVSLALPLRIKMLAEFFEIEIDVLITLFSLIDKNYQMLDKAKFPLPVELLQTIEQTGSIITLEETTGAESVANTNNILWLVQLSAVIMQWLNDHEMTVEQLEFICTESSQGEVEDIPSNEEIVDLFRELAGLFKTEMFVPELIVSAMTDQLSATAMMARLKDIETGVLTQRGLVHSLTTSSELLPVYNEIIREKLLIEAADLAKTGLEDDDLEALILQAQAEGFIDMDGYVSDTQEKFDFLNDPLNVTDFLSDDIDRAIASVVFRELADRAKNYRLSYDAAEAETTAIAEKIRIQAGRQQAVLLGTLEDTLNLTSDILRILLVTLFTSVDETEQMATVRFMEQVLDALDNEVDSGELKFNASLLTSFRRLQQFALLVLKTDLRARELEVLFYIREVQDSLPEKLKLPAPFNTRVDAMYSNADGDVFLFNTDQFNEAQYIRFSGRDYSFVASGYISELDEVPESFSGGIHAAVRDWAPQESERQSYLFVGDKFANTRLPEQLANTTDYWGRVRNNIVEQNHVDAAYVSADKNLFLFSGDQYVKYSDTTRVHVDEGYPKRTMENWNNENQLQLPVEIRKQVDSIFLDTDETTYFFSGDKFISSENPSSVQRTQNRWGQVINNIVDNNHVDAAFVNADATFLFSGDQYTKYSSADYTYSDEGYPLKIANNWNNETIIELAGDYLAKVDAAFTGTDGQTYFFNGNTWIGSADSLNPAAVNEKWGKVLNNIELNNVVDAALVKDGVTYLFSGDQYVKYSGTDYLVVDEGYPKNIARWNAMENTGTLPDTFNSSISAAFTAQDNHSYFFSENQYISSQPGAEPKLVKDSWAVVRSTIQSNNKIDAGFVAPDDTTYLFSGDQFFRYSGADYSVVDEGYPKTIQGNWGNLPASFNAQIDAAFIFEVDGKDRLYLFSGDYYVRYTDSNYSQIDYGYPQRLDLKPNPEGSWFDPIFKSSSEHHDQDHDNDDGYGHDRIIATIFTDQYNGKPRINYFYYDEQNREKLIKYEYGNNNKYSWSKSVFVSELSLSPFTSIDAGLSGADGKVYLFSNNNFAEMKGDYNGITTPTVINGTWGLILNRFQDLNRVDAAFRAVNGSTYLFCDSQYVKYSGDITPGESDFFSNEGYPKMIADNWSSENIGIELPTTFAAQEYAVFSAADGMLYSFSGNSFITSANNQAVSINEIWGKVENNFESLNRVDAGFVHDATTYLFSANQYTRYSGDYSGYADEGYPKKIAHMVEQDGIDTVSQFPDGINAIMAAMDESIYVFVDGKYVSSSEPTISADINSKFGIVRNNITDSGIIDAAEATANGELFLFSADQYVRYSAGSRSFVDEGYPKTIANWNNFEQGDLPDTLTKEIKAHVTDSDGEEYFFLQSSYFALSNPTDISPINSKWGKVDNNIQDSGIVDAAFISTSGKTYLFSGDQYGQYTPDVSTHINGGYPNNDAAFTYLDEGFPKRISDNWGEELPADYRAGLDAAATFDGRTYFFKGSTYIRYSDPAGKQIDSGFPREIAAHMSELPEFLLNDVMTFQQFKALSKVWSYPDNSILEYFRDSKEAEDKGELDQAEQLSRLISITKWKEQDITELVNQDNNILSQTDLADIQALTEMKNIFEATDDMASTPSTIKKEVWDKIHGTTVIEEDAASMLSGQLQTVVGASAWNDLASDLRNTMNAARRDALLGYLIFKMESSNDVNINWIDNPRELYEFLLIDVEMGEEAIASRIQEAIMCMQLFYHRMLINLENSSYKNVQVHQHDNEEEHSFQSEEELKSIKQKLKKWWLWMKNYRVWEANRKVFLYPENYIRPELRLDKSPEFKELEEALLQGDINELTAEAAFKTYLDKYSEISRLKVAGGYVYQRKVGDETDVSVTAEQLFEKKIIMFGHSNTEPKKYYYMTGDILEEVDSDSGTGDVKQTIDWAPWKSLDISINSGRVYPVFAFNRLFVFWVEVRERDQSEYSNSNADTGVSPDNKIIQYDSTIYYSFFNMNKEWIHPQALYELGPLIDNPTTRGREIFFDRKKTKKNNPKDYIDTLEALEGARLYVTNPITSKYYDSDEYVYVSYEARYTTKSASSYEFKFFGKLKSDLEFEEGKVNQNILDKLEKNVVFPSEKFSIKPAAYYHWKGFHNDSFTAPWFSFSEKGGSFLAKPYHVANPPEKEEFKRLVDDDPDNDTKIFLFGVMWQNLPDAGFTEIVGDQYYKHLFYSDSLADDATATQRYRVIGRDTPDQSVVSAWGNGNLFVWYPDEIESVVVNGDKLYMATENSRYLSYTGTDFEFMDQQNVADTTFEFSLSEILPADATFESWHRIREQLGDFLDTLENAFVYSGDNNLYLVASPLNDQGVPVREYTIPVISEFVTELAERITDPEVAAVVNGWTTVSSASVYTENNNRRLYITSGNSVFVKDYIAGTEKIVLVVSLIHPDFSAIEYDDLPVASLPKSWTVVATNLMEFLIRLEGVNKTVDTFNLFARKGDGTIEYTQPVADQLFVLIADIIDDPIATPIVEELTVLDEMNLFSSGSIKRLYLTSGNIVVSLDYTTGKWNVKNIDELMHPDVTAKVTDHAGMLPAGPAVNWADVAEDFKEYMATVTDALVWKGNFYLLTPKDAGGVEYSNPTAVLFWDSVATQLPGVAGMSTIDSAAVLSDAGSNQLVVTSGTSVVKYDFSAASWSLVTINSEWGVDFTKLDAIVQPANNNVYLFSGASYAVKQDANYSVASIESKWGFMPNAITITTKVDSAVLGEDGKIYLFSGGQLFRYSDINNRVIDEGFPRSMFRDDSQDESLDEEDLGLAISLSEIKEEFSADIDNVEIDLDKVKTHTAFIQKLLDRENVNDGDDIEKLYLFLDVPAEITTYTWRVRWRWVGGWRYKYRRRWSRIGKFYRFYFGYVRHRHWWGWWRREYYQVKNIRSERKTFYVRMTYLVDENNRGEYLLDEGYPRPIIGNWTNLPGDFNKIITATFEDRETINNVIKDVFYAFRSLRETDPNGQEYDTNDYVMYEGKQNFPKEIIEEEYEIVRLTSNTSEVLSQRLFLDGIDGLLSMNSQKASDEYDPIKGQLLSIELPVFDDIETEDEIQKVVFIADQEDQSDPDDEQQEGDLILQSERETGDITDFVELNDIITYSAAYIKNVPDSRDLDFESTNAQYYWEIFFHAPFLIAQTFNNAQKFDHSTQWYEYIFDPTEENEDNSKAFWKFLPFHVDIQNNQSADISNPIQYRRYLNDPFEPHAIAGLRQIAYRKTIVMAYVDNLIDHGDLLFRQYTRETINEARMLYVLAYDLLGKKPELIGTRRLSDAQTYKELRAEKYGLYMELVEMENLPNNANLPAQGDTDNPNGSLLDPYGYFYIPENREFTGYWERVEDRLFKIRQSLNINGVKQRLPLFEPPLDVMALVRAVGSGMGLAQALADYNVAIPHYRFSFMLAKSRELNSRVVSFGQSLLSALEKKDAEELALLRNTHEKAILKLTLDIKEAQLDDAKETLGSLRENLKGSTIREKYYSSLINDGLSPFEQAQLVLLTSGQIFTTISNVFETIGAFGGAVPEAGPFAFHWGGHNLKATASGTAAAYGAVAESLAFGANMSSILGGHHRRGQDWGLQRNLAQADIDSIERQIAGAEIKIKIARLDIQTSKTSIKNLESVDTFMKGKFTNQQLYRWMSSKLSGLYFQTYQMALDMAKGAQKTFQFELGVKASDVNYIGSLYWDSLKKGLLAGESLQVDLDRLEKAYIEKNTRSFEISKTISLQQLDPLALLNLRENRVCEFTLGEELFDYDFPGHYRRQIKTVSLTFPAVAGVYENVNATLTQLSHRTLIEPNKEGLLHLLDPSEPESLSIRADWRTNQQIALSRGVNDAGLFQLNFQDERYLPFEGTGAVSTWRLELNGQENAFDIRTLTDVVLKVEYMALQGGDVFAATVKKELKKNDSTGAKLFNLAEDFSAEWNRFMENPADGLSVKVTREMFPNMKTNKVLEMYMLFSLSKEGVRSLGESKLIINGNPELVIEQARLFDTSNLGTIPVKGKTWNFMPEPITTADMFTPENISNIALVCTYDKKPNF